MNYRILIILFLVCHVTLYSAYEQPTSKDSLVSVAQNASAASEQAKALRLLLSDFHLTESDLDVYDSIAKEIRFKDYGVMLSLFDKIQSEYCYLGTEQKCVRSNEYLKQLALKHKDINYQFCSYLSLAFHYFEKGNKKQSRLALKQAENILHSKSSSYFKNKYYYELSRQKRLEGKLDSALHYVNISLDNADEKDNYNGLADSYNSMGRIYRQLGNMEAAENAYLQSLEICEKYDLKSKLPKAYNNLGNMSHIKGAYDEAIAYYVESIAIKERRGDSKGLSIGFHNIGAIKVDLLDFEGAIKEYEKSNELANQIDFEFLKVHNAIKTGDAYYQLKKYKEANIYYNRGIEISDRIGFKNGNTLSLVGSGLNLIELGDLKISFDRLTTALSQSENSGNKSNECSALIGIAKWYINVQKSEDEKNMSFDRIESLLLRAKDLSEELDYGEKRLLVYESLNKLYKTKALYKKHSNLMTEYLSYKDTLFSKNRTLAIADWETKYSTAEKEKEIIQLQSANELSKLKTKTWQIALGLITIFLGLLGFFLYKYQKRRNEQKQMEEAEQFRTKISSDLHDDVGTILSSLAMQSELMGLTAREEQVEKFEKIGQMSREAMARMRDTVWAIDARKDTMLDLTDRMKDYIYDRLEGHKLQTVFNFDQVEKERKLTPEIRQNLYLIFKEAVHNAAKYSNGDKLKIVLKQKNEDIYLEVKDNGNTDKSKIKTSGLGLTNMKMRAKKMGKLLNIKTENGFSIIVE